MFLVHNSCKTVLIPKFIFCSFAAVKLESISVPAVVQNGSVDHVILDCPYSLTNRSVLHLLLQPGDKNYVKSRHKYQYLVYFH